MRRRALMGSVSGNGSVADWEWNGVEVPPNNTFWYKTVSGEMLSVSKITNITSHTYENGKAFIDECGYPVVVKPVVGVGAAETPHEAQKLATIALQKAGSAQSGERKEILAIVKIISKLVNLIIKSLAIIS